MPCFTQTNASATAPSGETSTALSRGGVFAHSAKEPRPILGGAGGVPRNLTVPPIEALARASSPGRAARLASLRDFLVRARALELDSGAAQELLEFPRRPSVRRHGDPGLHGALPPVAAERELPKLREREERADLEA